MISRYADLVSPHADAGKAEVLAANQVLCVAPTFENDWNALTAPPALPPVLAGPIVRRCERSAVWIWIATSVPVTVDGSVFESTDGMDSAGVATLAIGARIGGGSQTSIDLGKRLHVTLIKLSPDTDEAVRDFPVDRVLLYNLRLEASDLWAFSEMAIFHRRDVCLPGFPLPSFVVADPQRTKVRFLHASCRKLHGAGEDATPQMLEVLRSFSEDAGKRPAFLFLTGDQIYADDVDASLIPEIASLGRRLHGRRENIVPGETLSILPGGRRGELVKEGGFTSGHGDNHLIGFGEFAATYLLYWSPEVWERFGCESLSPANAEIRELMANVSTYMMFDDHEITDDWNLNREWTQKVANTSLTRRVVTNGLAAFWAFQWAGNDPTRGGSLASAATRYGVNPAPSFASYESAFLDFDEWTFTAPTNPACVFIDTRTRRDLSGRLAGLMDRSAILEMRRRIEAEPGGPNDPVMIVSPAPVLGVKMWEEIHELAPLEAIDPEDWSGNSEVFFDFFDALVQSGRRRFIFISGDVHFSHVAIARYERFDTRLFRASDLEMVQLTCSASKNEHPSTVISLLQKIASKHVEKRERGGTSGGILFPAHTKALVRDDPVQRDLSWLFLKDDTGELVLGANNVAEIELDTDPANLSITQRLRLADASTRTVQIAWDALFAGLREAR